MGNSERYEFLSAINTLKAGWLELRLAKWFGQKIEMVDCAGFKVTQALYRGRLYFLEFKDARPPNLELRGQASHAGEAPSRTEG